MAVWFTKFIMTHSHNRSTHTNLHTITNCYSYHTQLLALSVYTTDVPTQGPFVVFVTGLIVNQKFFHTTTARTETRVNTMTEPQETNHNTAIQNNDGSEPCLLYTSPSPRDATLSRMPSSA